MEVDNVIDVSQWQGIIDWEKVKRQCPYVILRCGYGSDEPAQDDRRWVRNVQECERLGIPYGVYFYSYANSNAKIQSEIAHTLRLLKQCSYKPFCVYLDLEESANTPWFEPTAEAWCKALTEAGYIVGVYAGQAFMRDGGVLANYRKKHAGKHSYWIPAYGSNVNGQMYMWALPNISGTDYDAWQYTSTKIFGGISGTVDTSIFYNESLLKGASVPSGEKPAEQIPVNAKTAEDLLNVARSYIGYSESNGSHREIIDLYNSHTPLAVGYVVKYTDAWCDTFVSACAIKAGMVDLIGTECGCERHVKIFQNKGIWIEDGNVVPKPGYIVLYNWDEDTQPNDGESDHIGIVESVSNGIVNIIEGNYNNQVARRAIPVGWGYIRGYASPAYGGAAETPAEETPSASLRPEIEYVVKTLHHGIRPAVRNGKKAGYENDAITGIAIRAVGRGSVKYRVHVTNGYWLDWVTGYDWNDVNNGYAGWGNLMIDALQLMYYTDTSLTGGKYFQAAYQVMLPSKSWLGYVYDTDFSDGDGSGAAGLFYHPFTDLRIHMVEA